MTADEITVPRNIQRFEVLLYASLMLDALSFPFRDMPVDASDATMMAATLLSAGLILLFVHLVRLAARRHKNWARWVLLASLILSALSLAAIVGDEGWQIENLVDLLSSVLTAAGLYYSFIGDAVGWFDADKT